jgi:hypothetical protein
MKQQVGYPYDYVWLHWFQTLENCFSKRVEFKKENIILSYERNHRGLSPVVDALQRNMLKRYRVLAVTGVQKHP